MRRYLAALALAALAGRGAAFAEPAPAKTPTRPKSHGYSLAGVVMRVDVAAKTFVVRANSGVETTLVRTSATHVPGELLRPGDKVAVRYPGERRQEDRDLRAHRIGDRRRPDPHRPGRRASRLHRGFESRNLGTRNEILGPATYGPTTRQKNSSVFRMPFSG